MPVEIIAYVWNIGLWTRLLCVITAIDKLKCPPYDMDAAAIDVYVAGLSPEKSGLCSQNHAVNGYPHVADDKNGVCPISWPEGAPSLPS